MTKPNDNAFQEGTFGTTNTLTKREYFAALVMQGIIITPEECTTLELAQEAVRCADALIEALNEAK